MASGKTQKEDWEYAWSEAVGRYYYFDRKLGISQWIRPASCTLQLPREGPKHTPKAPPCPVGWIAVFDSVHQRHYFYNEVTKARTWFKPSGEDKTHREFLKKIVKSKDDRSASGTGLAAIMWDPEAFLQCYKQARMLKDVRYLHEILADVQLSNHQYAKRGGVRGEVPPETSKVYHSACIEAVKNGEVKAYRHAPTVTISSMSVEQALMHEAKEDKTRLLCGVNIANGSTPGGEYDTGGIGQEESLCRRMPSLHPSLVASKAYPFGPCTIEGSSRSITNACDVLLTKPCRLAREELEHGYGFIEHERQAKALIVSAGSPEQCSDGVMATSDKLLLGNLESIFIAPVLMSPGVTTLVLSPYGFTPGRDATSLANLLTKVLTNPMADYPEVCLGRLYHEIHVAIPPTMCLTSEPFDLLQNHQGQPASEFRAAFFATLSGTGLDVRSLN